MKYCIYCGAPLNEGAITCSNCGKNIGKPKAVEKKKIVTVTANAHGKKNSNNDVEEFTEIKTSVTNAAEKAISSAKGFGNQISKAVEDKKTSIKVGVEDQARKNKEAQIKQEEAEKRRKAALRASAANLSTEELWSDYRRNQWRDIFYSEEPSKVTEEEYIEKLQSKLEENKIPANVEVRTIEWDRSNIKRKTFFVQPKTDVANPLSFVVQLNHVGKYSFAEEKIFITPPKLPEKPELPMSLIPLPLNLFIAAGVFLLLGLLLFFIAGPSIGLILMAIGGALGIYVYFRMQKNNAIKEHNNKCKEQEKAWNDAWTNWHLTKLAFSFQEEVNGELTRIFDAVLETIKQVTDELFENKPIDEKEESVSMNELEELFKRRQDDYR